MVNANYGLYGSPQWRIYCAIGGGGGLHNQESHYIPTRFSGTYLGKKILKHSCY